MSRDDRLRLAAVGMHPDRARALVAEHGSPGAVCRAVAAGRVVVPERARRVASAALDPLLERLSGIGARVLLHGDPGYPAHLAALPDAPDVLFVRGTLPTAPMVAIVGTRRCTRYGSTLASAYGRAVVSAGWVVVSGLARGIDGAAHQGVVGAGGVGVAVLGCGPDIAYPREHRQLAADLLAGGGAVISEYPPGTPPQGWRFPPRNRIISGLSAAVVVVETPERGGALVTAVAALDQGRTVMAVPGDVDRHTSRGCNLLVRDGALPVLDPDDLVEALSLVPGLSGPTGISSPAADPVLVAVGNVGASLDELAERLELPARDVAARVARLEVAGLVASDQGLIVRLHPRRPQLG